MARWLVVRKYKSHVGSYKPGDEIELDEATADFLQRDSPGMIMPMEDPKKPDDAEPETRAVEAPPADRMVRRPSRNRGR